MEACSRSLLLRRWSFFPSSLQRIFPSIIFVFFILFFPFNPDPTYMRMRSVWQYLRRSVISPLRHYDGAHFHAVWTAIPHNTNEGPSFTHLTNNQSKLWISIIMDVTEERFATYYTRTQLLAS